jgi:hypothetical protein
MTTLTNACCNSTNATLAIEKQKARLLPGPNNQSSAKGHQLLPTLSEPNQT